ncbi:hypothetical protein BAU14_10620 [Enterococcus sp. CU9D]|nr:hypothetical protein BAU14_10620 [Enterococcus sp. CU9D]
MVFLKKVDLFSNSDSKVAKFGKCFGFFRITFVIRLTTKFFPILTTVIVKVGQSRTIQRNLRKK